jgi:hypothetical protein
MGVAAAYDNFSRADNAASLGVSTSGHTWTAFEGTCGISGKQAFPSNGTAAHSATIDTGISEIDLRATLVLAPTDDQAGVVFRYTTGFNGYYFRADTTSGNYRLEKYDGASTVVSGGPAPANGDAIRVIAVGSAIRCYVNGALACSMTDAFNSSATNCGVSFYFNAVARIDDFAVGAPSMPGRMVIA